MDRTNLNSDTLYGPYTGSSDAIDMAVSHSNGILVLSSSLQWSRSAKMANGSFKTAYWRGARSCSRTPIFTRNRPRTLMACAGGAVDVQNVWCREIRTTENAILLLFTGRRRVSDVVRIVRYVVRQELSPRHQQFVVLAVHVPDFSRVKQFHAYRSGAGQRFSVQLYPERVVT